MMTVARPGYPRRGLVDGTSPCPGSQVECNGCRRWRGTTLRCLSPGKLYFVCVIISSHQPKLFPPFFQAAADVDVDADLVYLYSYVLDLPGAAAAAPDAAVGMSHWHFVCVGMSHWHFVCVIISSHQPELFPPFFRPPQTSTSTLTWCTCIPTCWICPEPPPPPPTLPSRSVSHISPVSHILCVLSSVLISLSCFPLFSGRRRRGRGRRPRRRPRRRRRNEIVTKSSTSERNEIVDVDAAGAPTASVVAAVGTRSPDHLSHNFMEEPKPPQPQLHGGAPTTSATTSYTHTAPAVHRPDSGGSELL